MKINSPKDPFDMICWHGEGITDARQAFAAIFSLYMIKDLRVEIRGIVTCAQADKLYQRCPPCDVLLNMKVVRSAIKVAYVLRDENIVQKTDALNTTHYYSYYQTSNLWSSFPRCLSEKEFCNPYSVFKKFFRKQSLDKWVHKWEEVVEYALSPHSSGTELDTLHFYTLMIKLLEAAHLIYMREVMLISCVSNHASRHPKIDIPTC